MAYTINSTAQRHLRRNFSFGVLNGVFFSLFGALLDPSLVLSWFVSQLRTSNFLIGLIMPIQNGGWFLPQLLMSSYLQRRQRKIPFYTRMAGVRMAVWCLMTLAIFFVEDPAALLVVFFTLLTAYSLGAALSGLCFVDFVAKAIPPTRRGSFFAWRLFLGGLLALGGSLLVKYILDEGRGLSSPDNYAMLFLLSFFALCGGLGSLALVVEPLEPVNEERVPLGRQFRRALDLPRRDSNYLKERTCFSLPFDRRELNARGNPGSDQGRGRSGYRRGPSLAPGGDAGGGHRAGAAYGHPPGGGRGLCCL